MPKETQKEDLKTSKKNDGIAFHYHETGHAIDFENTQIIAEEKHTGKADNINRGIEIKKLSQAERAHLQMGNEIDPIWDTFIESIKT